jgi:tetratricopeptide (TPR) repeat protein
MPLFDDLHADVRQALVSNIVSLSAPRWEEEITSRLTAMLDSASRGLLPMLVTALHTMACGSDREDVHLGLVSAWKRQNQQANRTLEAIGAIGHPDARTLLLSQLDSGNRTVVQSTITGLSRLGDPAAIPPLEASFERATATSLFRVLHEALSRLAKGWHRLYYAQNAMARGNPRAALAAMHDYVADNPDDGEAYLERGRALHWNGELVAAHDDYLLAVQHLHRPELALHGAALAAHQMGDLDSALVHFDQAMQKHRGFGEVRLRRGLLHLERLDYAAALVDFLAAATSSSVISSLHQRIASVLVDVVKLFVDAPPGQPPTRVELLSLMDRPLPNRFADLVLIWALILTRRFNEARQCLDRFASRWPEARAYTLLNTAWLYTAAGDIARAQEALEDLEVHAVGQGYHWPTYLLHAFAEWPVVREPLTAMMFQAAGREP